MNFFFGQETLSITQWVLRGVIAYCILLLAVKILGQRSISQLRLLDFVISITLGNILAHPLSDEGLGMTGSLTTTIVLVVMYVLSIKLSMKFRNFELFLAPPPIPIISNGEILYKNMSKANISIDFLLSELRLEKIEEAKKIAMAYWEPGGRISIFLNPEFQNLTPKDMQISTSPFEIPTVLIRDGEIDKKALKDMNKTKEWLIEMLRNKNIIDVKNILLATIDTADNIQLYFKQK